MTNNNAKKFRQKFSPLAVGIVVLLGSVACNNGLDFDTRSCHDCVIDLGNEAKHNSVKYPGAMAYAYMAQQGTSNGLGDGLLGMFEELAAKLEDLLDLPKLYSFETTKEAKFKASVTALLDTLRKDVWPKLADADKTDAAARDAVVAIKAHILDNDKFKTELADFPSKAPLTGGFCNNPGDLLDPNPLDPQPECDKLVKSVQEKADELYQAAAYYVLAIPQRDATGHLKKVEQALAQMNTNLTKGTVIPGVDETQTASDTLSQALATVKTLKYWVGLMATMTPVVNRCVDETGKLVSKVDALQASYVAPIADAAARSEAEGLLRSAKAAAGDLKAFFNTYDANEALVKGSGAGAIVGLGGKPLKQLLSDALTSGKALVGVGLGLQLSDGHDLVWLRDALTEHRMVSLEDDKSAPGATSELLMALAFDVIAKKDPSIDKIDNLYALSPEALERERRTFGMSPAEYNSFVISQARKAYLSKSTDESGAHYNTAMVIYRDLLGDAIDMPKLLAQFGDGMVIVVTKDVTTLDKGVRIIPGGLDTGEAAAVAMAVGTEELKLKGGAKRTDIVSLSENIAKGMTAFGKANIKDVARAMKQVLATTPSKSLTYDQIPVVVKDVLENFGIPRGDLDRTNVLGLPVTEVKMRLKQDRTYFSRMVK